jgi:hypothetical protein
MTIFITHPWWLHDTTSIKMFKNIHRKKLDHETINKFKYVLSV